MSGIYLASKSPRRSEILKLLEVEFEVLNYPHEESVPFENESSEYLLIDLFCLKGILKKIISFKNNSFILCIKIIFRANFCRSASSLASFLNLSIFDVYKTLDEIPQRLDLENTPKNLKIIILLTTLKYYE